MHFTDYWAIVERDHPIQNPSSPAKLERLAQYCGVRDGFSVLDIGCGKGGLLNRWAERWAIDGTGLEINPHFVAAARTDAEASGTGDRIRWIEGSAREFKPQPASYDIVTCIGASFALGSFKEAVTWMRRAVKPGGVLAIGEIFANETPFPAAARDQQPLDLAATVAALQAHDLDLIGLIAASHDDWDHYVSQQWRTADAWARSNPEHPHRADVLHAITDAQRAYWAWQRRFLGWAIFVARPTLD